MPWQMTMVVGIALAVVMVPAARADDQDIIDYREHIMKSMGEQVSAIGQILDRKIPADSFATHVQILEVTTATAKAAFKSSVPGGKAKPDVWAKWQDFANRLDVLTAATAELAKTAQAGGINAAAPKVSAALTCKGCHDIYSSQVGDLPVAALPAGGIRAGDKDVIDYREHIMRTLNEQAAALGQILSTAIPDDNATAHLDAIAMTASVALKAFEPMVPGGEAKPEVWNNWPDFSKRMAEFSRKIAAAAKLAKEQGSGAAMANIVDVLNCKECHDIYRQEPKK